MQAVEEAPTVPEASKPESALRRFVSLKSVQIVAAFVLILVVMGWIQSGGPAILDNDGYYHIRWAAMLRESFPHLPVFKALPLTTLNEKDYVDHHYLFHLLLIPFTLGDLRMGAKLAAVVFSSLGILSMFALMVAFRVRFRWLWLAPLVASSEPFLYRFAMTRAPALSLALLGLGTYLILKRKLLLLGVLGFAFVWFYSLFPLLIAFTLAQAAAVYMSERRIDLWPALVCALGIVAGLAINPYFPHNLALLAEHFRMKATGEYAVDVGVEWYPYETLVLLQTCGVALVIHLAGMLSFDFKSRARDAKPLFFLFVSVLFLLMTLLSRRFVEYWPPFAVLFAAFTVGPKLESANFSWFARTRDRVIGVLAAAVVLLASIGAMGFNIVQARIDVKDEADPYAYQGASEWLANNTPPGTRVFNTDWDDFPMLFYYNPQNTYIAGLDPTYLFDKDHDLWKLYASITLGEEEKAGPLIRDRFGADYVFTDNEHPDFVQNATDSGDFEEVYKDQFTTVLRVRGPDEPRPQKDEEDSDEQ